VNAPAIVIRLEFEARPRIVCDWLDETDERRMRDWLDSHPELLELLARACEIANRERTR